MGATSRARGGPSPFQVVVVEDHADLRAMCTECLEHAGMSVRAFATERAALDAIHERVPDVVLTDLNLGGGLGGVRIAKELRRRDATSDVTILLMTGTGGVSFEEERLFDAVLLKPIDARRLPEVLRSHAAARVRLR